MSFGLNKIIPLARTFLISLFITFFPSYRSLYRFTSLSFNFSKTHSARTVRWSLCGQSNKCAYNCTLTARMYWSYLEWDSCLSALWKHYRLNVCQLREIGCNWDSFVRLFIKWSPSSIAAVEQHWTLCHWKPKMAWNHNIHKVFGFFSSFNSATISPILLCNFNGVQMCWKKKRKKNVGKMPNVDVIYIDVVSTYKYWKFR